MFPLKTIKCLIIPNNDLRFGFHCPYNPFVNSPMIRGLLVNAITGSVANGSCKLITAFNRSFMPLRSLMSLKNAT